MSKTTTKPKEIYLRVHNIHWNEGPEKGYTGPKNFWFVFNSDVYKLIKSDPINKFALFQVIENELEDSGKYGGIASDLLEIEWVHKEEFKEKKNYKRWGVRKGQNIEVTDYTDIQVV